MLVRVLLWDGLGLVDRPVMPSAARIISTHQPPALDTQRHGPSQYAAASKRETLKHTLRSRTARTESA